ncbi:MAG: ferredoxin [Natronomonas sp.]
MPRKETLSRLLRLVAGVSSPFDVLGIDADADEAEIKQAYQERVKEAHPDHGGTIQEFQRVRTAYESVKSQISRSDGTDEARVVDGEPAAEAEPTEEEPEEQQADARARVEYLNYEVLDDHGWSLDDEALFERASDAGLDHNDYGRILVESGESLLEAAENRGLTWPYACRGGACANCAIAVVGGESSMPVDHILPEEMTDRGIRLSCVGAPITDEMQVVYNVKHLPYLDDLRLPPHPFEHAHRND